MAFEAVRRTTKIYRGLSGLALAIMLMAPSTPSPARSTWAIDPARTRISFSIDAVGYPKTTGAFNQFEGRIAVDFDHPAKSLVNFRVKSGSVDVGSASFTDYLRSEVLLNSARFPEIVFESKSVEKIDDHHARVLGDLTMLGVTHPLNVDVEIRPQQSHDVSRLGFIAQAKIDRLAFGMNSGFPIISREVDLTVMSEAFTQ